MPKSSVIEYPCPTRRVGEGHLHHFFGYYNKNIWGPGGQYLLANQVPMMTGNLSGTEPAEVGYFDLDNGDIFHLIGETTAWNWQMGCQLQWREAHAQREIIYNVRRPGAAAVYCDFVAVAYNMDTGQQRQLPLPVYVLAPTGEYALCVDYSRFQLTHETIGYSATTTEPELPLAPADDGIYKMHLDTGAHQLVLSLSDLAQFQPVASMVKAIHWVTHLEINPTGNRFLFIHRWTERVEDETCFLHRLFTCSPDGSNLRLLECTDHELPQLSADFDPTAVGTFDYEKSQYQISHPAWRDDDTVVVWGPHNNAIHYHLYHEHSGRVEVLGPDILTENGHMTYSPNGRWLLSDTYPDTQTDERYLFLYDVKNDRRYNIGSFYTPPDLGKHNRCDLHPRWNRDGTQVCIDSVHQGSRQLYVIDVAALVEA